MTTKTTNTSGPEVCKRSARTVIDHERDRPRRCATRVSIAEKIGRAVEWVKKAEIGSGKCAGVLAKVADKLGVLEREVRALRQANEILQKASAYFGNRKRNSTAAAIIAFIDHHCYADRVEPICRVLSIAPATYRECVAQRRPPRSTRTTRRSPV